MSEYGRGGMEDGFSIVETDEAPPKTAIDPFTGKSGPNYERQVYDRSSGKYFDGYRGGFVGRHPSIND